MPMLLQRMWIQVTSDRKRFGALCAMVAVGLLLWGRIILINNVPRTAVADPAAGAAETAAAQEKTEPDKPRPTMAIALARQPMRDPFRISEAHFPRPLQSDSIASVEPKSTFDQDEDPDVKEARLVQRLKLLAGHYRLEALMPANDMAVISGQAFRVGDDLVVTQIEGSKTVTRPIVPDTEVFRLVDVWPRSVIIESHGHWFELNLEAITPTPQNATPKSGKR